MTGWWQHNENRDFPFADRYGQYLVRQQATAGGVLIPRNFLVDAFFVHSVTSASSGGAGVEEDYRPYSLDLVNHRPQGLTVVRIAGTNGGVLVTVSPHTDFLVREENLRPRIYYEFEIPDTAERWDKFLAPEMMAYGGDLEEVGGPYAVGGYGILVVGCSPASVPVGAVFSLRVGDNEPEPASLEADCILYVPRVMLSQVSLAVQVPSRYVVVPESTDLDGSTFPTTRELRAVHVTSRVTPLYAGSPNPFRSGFNALVELEPGSVALLGKEGEGLGHACTGINRLPSDAEPVSCSGLVKSVAGVTPTGGNLVITGGPGISEVTEPGLVVLVVDGEEVTGGSV